MVRPEDLKRAYDEAMVGATPPTEAIVPGGFLNTHLKSRRYDDTRMYLLTPDGIYVCNGDPDQPWEKIDG